MKKILTINDDPKGILRKCAEPIKKFDKDLDNIIDKMLDLCSLLDGYGLAAPQIGISKRIIVAMDRAFVNPEILQLGEETSEQEEGCLSLPGEFIKIKRSNSILLSFSQLSRKRILVSYEGMIARVIQHEIDHLNGKLMIDYK